MLFQDEGAENDRDGPKVRRRDRLLLKGTKTYFVIKSRVGWANLHPSKLCVSAGTAPGGARFAA